MHITPGQRHVVRSHACVRRADPLQAVELPELPDNAKYLHHPNECYDWGTFGWVFTTEGIAPSSYQYFIFVNSSVRGPFLPAYLQARHLPSRRPARARLPVSALSVSALSVFALNVFSTPGNSISFGTLLLGVAKCGQLELRLCMLSPSGPKRCWCFLESRASDHLYLGYFVACHQDETERLRICLKRGGRCQLSK